MVAIVAEYEFIRDAAVAVKGGSVATGTVVSVGACVGVSVAVGAMVAVSTKGVFPTANGVCVETGIWVTWASCVAALQAINRSIDNTNKDLFTFNMVFSFLLCYTIT
jgi:hypothetical protein